MIVRKMHADDIDFALSLTSEEGWSDIRSDFESLISYSPAAVFVGEEEGKRIGMVSAVSYGRLGFIGCLIVARDSRNKSFGTDLMKYAVDHIREQGAKTIMLDAVEAAIPLYKRLGFMTYCRSLRMMAQIEPRRSDMVRPMRKRDLPDILDLDLDHFGADRSHFLKCTWKLFPRFCKTIRVDGTIQGYVMGSPRGDSVRVAPLIVNEGPYHGEHLLHELAAESGEKTLRMGVLESNTSTVRLLRELGAEEGSPSYRMVLGDSTAITAPSGINTIGSPAKG